MKILVQRLKNKKISLLTDRNNFLIITLDSTKRFIKQKLDVRSKNKGPLYAFFRI